MNNSRGNLKRETEPLLIAAKSNDLRTIYKTRANRWRIEIVGYVERERERERWNNQPHNKLM